MQALTPEQIAALAPDDASVKAAKSLVNPSKWVLLEHDDRALWGHCQGSGKNPYQTAIDLSEPAFKCSCPSRKFPCKHGLALLYMFTQHGNRFQAASLPEWVGEWLEKRNKNAAAKIAKENAPIDEAAQQKRHDARLKKVANGLADLRIWLDDLIRNGLISWKNESYERCNEMAKRMIDAQMPTLSGSLQQLAHTPDERQDVLLHRLTKLSLLEQSFQKINQLPENWQAEIFTRLGFPIAKEQVLANPAHLDIWRHIGTSHQDIDRGVAHTHWLYGDETGKFAHIIDFKIQGAPNTPPSVLANGVYAGELCFYDGVQMCRALPKTWEYAPTPPKLHTGSQNIAQAWEKAHSAYAENPLLTHYPMRCDALHLLRDGTNFALSDGAQILPISLSESEIMRVLSWTKGGEFGAFILWDFEFSESKLLSVYNHEGNLNVLAL